MGIFLLSLFSSWLLLGDKKVVHFPLGLVRTFPVVPKRVTPPFPLPQTKRAEVSQGATCFSLIFDNDSELQFDEPHQLLGFCLQYLMQRVNCSTDVWCRKFYDV